MSFNHELIDNMINSSESNMEKYKNNSLNENISNICNLENEKIYFTSKDSLKIHQENMKSSENLENENNTFSDTNENEISMYSKYKEKHENNSIVKYRNFVKESILKNNIKNNVICVYEEKNNIDNDISLSNNKKNSELKLNQENNIDLQAIEKNSSIESNINKYNSIESSILISSSSELDDENLNMYAYEKNKKNKNIPCSENSKDNSQVFENDVYLANIYIDNNDDNIDTSLFAKEINQLGKK